jgi:hypothetical protein
VTKKVFLSGKTSVERPDARPGPLHHRLDRDRFRAAFHEKLARSLHDAGKRATAAVLAGRAKRFGPSFHSELFECAIVLNGEQSRRAPSARLKSQF